MKTYFFYVDQKVTSWYRTDFEIEADNLEEAKKQAAQFFEEGNTLDLPWEQCDETIEPMSVEENGGESVTQIFTDSSELFYEDGNKK